MKKLFAAILSAFMICLVMPVTVSAATQFGGSTTTWEYADNTLTIGGTGPMPNITPGIYPWSSNLNDITNVVIQNGVTSIGNYAFECIPNLTNVIIPNSIVSIGNEAFNSCANLNAITIPASVTNMGSNIFDGCDQIIVYHFAGSGTDSYDGFDASYCLSNPIGAVINYENLGGADNSRNPISYLYNQGVISFNALSGRPGYEFVRWEPSSISESQTIPVTVTAIWREIPTEDTSTPPHISQPSYDPSYNYSYPVPTPIIDIIENIDVTAILNKSGSVDSYKTRLEVLRAARTKGVTKITLILPENCKGISTGAIQKCFKAAGDVKIYLSYDGKTVRLTDKSRQVLTGLYYS